MSKNWKNCKACGNRFPEKDGVGPEKEFCCEGCWEEWEEKHPGYTKQTRRIKFFLFIIIFGLIIFFIIKHGPI